MRIQITSTKSIDWTPPWERNSGGALGDVVGIELESGLEEGCPAVRLRRTRGQLALAAVGYVPTPSVPLPSTWDDPAAAGDWVLPPLFRAKNAAVAIHSKLTFTRQTAAAPYLVEGSESAEGVPTSADDMRTVFRKMSDETSVLQAGIPEYQLSWASHLLPFGSRPVMRSVQTVPCALLASLSAQPGFCAERDEAAIFVTRTAIYLAGFRKGVPLLFRECPGIAGLNAMRNAIKHSLGLDETMLSTVLASNGIIDTRPVLLPLLAPVLSQIEISLDYLKSRLGADIRRLMLVGDAMGCNLVRHVLDGRFTMPLETPNPFDGLKPPAKATPWKNEYCIGEPAQAFLTALGTALAAMEGGAE